MSGLRKTLGKPLKGVHRSGISTADFSPLKWSNYFDRHSQVSLDSGVFHYYVKGDKGPLLVTLHGGGYSALTWSLFAKDIASKIECTILSIDLRGHGSTVTNNDDDLSLDQFAKDVNDVVCAIYEDAEIPPIILIGHSMGGAIAVEVAPLLSTSLVGMCVIDVVEGTAIDSLSSMQSILRSRPKSFKSVEQAVQWGYRGGSTHNLEAARVSMPGQIMNNRTGVLASEDVAADRLDTQKSQESVQLPERAVDSISEGDEADIPQQDAPPIIIPTTSDDNAIKYVWRIDLSKTEKFWSGWFQGLSHKFLSINAPKILLLANIHGLDTSLTVGQMQGKFQLQVLQRSGHAIHEDQPSAVADIVASYVIRQKLAKAIDGFDPIAPPVY